MWGLVRCQEHPNRLPWMLATTAMITLLATTASAQDQEPFCSAEVVESCCSSVDTDSQLLFNCSRPGLGHLTPGIYQGVVANYLSFATDRSSPNFRERAVEFEACTGGTIVFAEAQSIWEDPLKDLGTRTTRGSELYDGYFMSYSHYPEVSALGLAETLNERVRQSNAQLKWEDVLPQVKHMGEYRKDGVTNIDFLMYDGDFFVPFIRLDLLELYNFSLPNTWEEVVEYAKFFNGKDLNGDGEPDYGFCHFPRVGAGHWDWWFSEAVYSTWASISQTRGLQQGFFFDVETMQPQIGEGFRKAVQIWKDLWSSGSSSLVFPEGRCAIGFGPPGEWKGIILDPNGVSRKDEEGNVLWQATYKNGSYAEPYRLKPFGSLSVEDPETGKLVECTRKLCPRGELVPPSGHHAGDRLTGSDLLPVSSHEGKLINRAPFYWSGGLGTLIRKSSTEERKDLLWDFFVYTNSPETSVHDVASYRSWLDSWRHSQLSPGENFVEAGWSDDAIKEHVATMQWALSDESNGAMNLRVPGALRYTRDVMGEIMNWYIDDEITLDEAVDGVKVGWNEITEELDLIEQLDIYRSALLLDSLSEVELCRLHREQMDARNPSICRAYDSELNKRVLVPSILVPSLLLVAGLVAFIIYEKKKRKSDLIWQIQKEELQFGNPPEVLGRGTFGLVFLAEYRGTQVAVKRVIPPLETTTGSPVNSAGTVGKDVEEGLASTAKGASNASADPTSISYSSILSIEPMSSGAIRVEKTVETALTAKQTKAEHSKMKANFIQEMRQLAKLRHPCITTVMGAVVSNGNDPMLVMEYMDHGSFHDMLHNETMQFDGEILLSIFRGVAQGVRFLHSATPQLCHSDLKASNILVDSRFRAKVADFGLSSKRRAGAAGTPFWLAPELLRGETGNTAESDAYAFGMILWEAYSRKDPYEGENPQEVLQLVADPVVNKRPICPDACPKQMAHMMAQCMHSEPKRRPIFEELDLHLRRLDGPTLEPLGKPQSTHQNQSKDKAEDLLSEVFPAHIAAALKEGRAVEPETRDIVTIFFSEIDGFESIVTSLPPLKVSSLLSRLYARFDDLAREHGVHKLETIGDSYMAVTNLVGDQLDDHAKRMADFAAALVEAAKSTLLDEEDPDRGAVSIRAGFHSGPIVANVVGSRNPRYSLFGEAVNTAQSMKQTGMPNRIHCSERTAMLLQVQSPDTPMALRGEVAVRNKGVMRTYWVHEEERIKPVEEARKSRWDA